MSIKNRSHANKFLNLYPAFWEPKIGDTVRVIKILDEHGKVNPHVSYGYKIGDYGVIVDHANLNGLLAYRVRFEQSDWLVFKEELELS